MSIQAWLGNTSKEDFVKQYYGKLPFSQSGGGVDTCQLGTWEVLGQIVVQPEADVMVVRQNQQYAGPNPKTQEDAERLSAEGYTILVRHAERHHDELASLAAGFERDFAAPVNIHMYATPSAQYGFGWHYDCEEVFILQTTGRKEYSLRKNTVNPWPLEETIPADMRYGREIMPLMRCSLEAGDWLYIPAGYWHMAQAEETAISLAIGVMAPAAIHLLDHLRLDLLDSLLWRQRLPVCGDASPCSREQLVAQYRDLHQQLIADLSKRMLRDDWIEAWIDRNTVVPPKA